MPKTFVAVQFAKPGRNAAKWGVVHRTWLSEDLRYTAWPLAPLCPERAARTESLPMVNWPKFKISATFLAESSK